jgi:large subunit ribosomal protein L25
MRISYTFGADPREAHGKGASRRLRHSGKVPAILYGGHKEAEQLVLDQQNLLTMIADERFYSSIVMVKMSNGTQQEAIIKDVQMHPARNVVVHVDLQRVVESESIRIKVPIHFKGESISPGVKTQGGVVSHMRADVEIVTLPKDLPEFLELDLSGMSLHETKFLSDIPLPTGVSIPELTHRNAPVVSIHSPRAEEPEPVAAEAVAATPAEGAAAAPAAPGAPGAAPATAAAGDAQKGEEKKEAAPAKKEGGKK